MQFTRLRLNGFKSFVDPTDLVISNGLTGVVGPNGCGKSNLLEALRWVMGETRPSAMRGGGMEDVIFAGAATRGQRNFAEVTLHIDNTDRLAPPSLNDRDMVEIVRRITRDAGSAYKANGKEVRARDVQMLFADASTGAHSPALVRQGQISELINAKPKARRRVLEEAAGISGLYQRRHEAELKLKNTETNLARVEDVIDQLAQQLGQLGRQAKQAARYRAIGEQLRAAEGLLLFRRWRDAEVALGVARQGLTDKVTAAARAETAARMAEAARAEAEDGLPALREEDAIAAAVLQRALVERDTLAGKMQAAEAEIIRLDTRLQELSREEDREDQLDADAQRMRAQLGEEAEALIVAGAGHADKLDEAEALADAAADELAQREEDMTSLTEAVAELAARHQAVARLVADNRRLVDRETAQADRAEAAVVEASEAEAQGAEAYEAAEAAAEIAGETVAEAEEAAEIAEEQRSDAQTAEATARAAASEAGGEAKALRAEVTGLQRLLAKDRGTSGQILDEVRAAPGFERALGAALADDLKAPRLGDGRQSGWVALDAYREAPALPAGAPSLALQVAGCDVLARRLSQVGVVPADQGAALQPALLPGQRLVSREGDLWRWDGLVAAAADAPSAAALRLEQENRLAALSEDLDAAEARASEASGEHEAARAALSAANSAETATREARRRAETALSDATRSMTKAEADRNLAASKVEALQLAAVRHREAAGAAEAELMRAEAQADALENLGAARARAEAQKTVVEAARLATLARRTGYDEIRRDGQARDKRAQQVAKELADWDARIASAIARREDLVTRRAATDAALMVARDVPMALAADGDRIAAAVQAAETRKATAADAVSVAEAALRQAGEAERLAERTASEVREARARAEAVVNAAQAGLDEAAHRIAETLDLTPEKLRAELDVDLGDIPDADNVEATVARLRRSRDALGAVNLRAEEDAREVQTEHDTLKQEKLDLEAAIAKLRAGISSLNREGRERLLTAFEEVNASFRNLFTHLFRGGEANLVLVESDDPLEAGLEIMCQPPGKKLSTLSLLSGGEQTLTALALIFAVFLANPAPICVLDEVDAPLDDANVTRFCDMLDEMTRRTQTRFLVITHHAVTMARMDRLFGVTMGEQGVSQLVSVDLKRAASMVA